MQRSTPIMSSYLNSTTGVASAKRRRSQFRPCIDLHDGVVKQIVGGTLDLDQSTSPEAGPSNLKTNFVATYVCDWKT